MMDLHSYTLLSCLDALYNSRVDMVVMEDIGELVMVILGSGPRGTPHLDHTSTIGGRAEVGLVAIQVKLTVSKPRSCKP